MLLVSWELFRSVSLCSGCLVMFLAVDFQAQVLIKHELDMQLLALQVGGRRLRGRVILATSQRDEGVDVDLVRHAG